MHSYYLFYTIITLTAASILFVLAIYAWYRFARQESATAPLEARLTAQQEQILHLVAQGLTYREVGERLNYAESTIKKHMGQIMRQLHLKNRAEAVEYARRTGL